jgi:CDP-diacylglycerol--glycerol-3-phosphate 3-phosphatidyltransferase
MSSVLDTLRRVAPVFPVYEEDIRVLASPQDFYSTILQLISDCQRELIISSLYFGTDDKTRQLIDAIDQKLGTNAEVKVTFMIDYSRGTRGHTNSVTLLKALVIRHGAKRVSLLAWQHCLSPISRFVPKIGEIYGVHHMKFVLADDTVLLTGANISKIYFEDRIDRYMVVANAQEFNMYLKNLVAALEGGYSRYSPTKDRFLVPKSNLEWQKKLEAAISPPIAVAKGCQSEAINIIPCVQIPFINIKQDTAALMDILDALEDDVSVKEIMLSTSYFNPFDSLEKHINSSTKRWRIISSAPSSSSFYKAKGPSSLIPELYRQLALKIGALNPMKRVYEWHQPGQTFHAKGRANNKPTVSFIQVFRAIRKDWSRSSRHFIRVSKLWF